MTCKNFVVEGYLQRPYWYGDFACLLALKNKNNKRVWLWLAHDSMSRAEFSALNALLKSNTSERQDL